jgi:hypothetical protein
MIARIPPPRLSRRADPGFGQTLAFEAFDEPISDVDSTQIRRQSADQIRRVDVASAVQGPPCRREI